MRYAMYEGGEEKYSFNEREDILDNLSLKVSIQGSCFQRDQYLQLRLKQGVKMNDVKKILKDHFGIITFRLEYYWNSRKDKGTFRYCPKEDILKLCRIFLKNNKDIDYYSRFDPLRERDKISKVVYQYGSIRYDLL